MNGSALCCSTSFAILLGIASATAEEYGSADAARAMLNRATIILKLDEQTALEEFKNGEDTFLDRDLYVFCANASEHRISAHPNHLLIGQPTQEVKDADGKAFVEEMITVATEPGKVSEVHYRYQRLGYVDVLPKVTFVARVKNQVCGVGYYP